MYTYKTESQVRAAFWEFHPDWELKARKMGVKSKGQNAQSADVRLEWCDFVDYLARDGLISESLAQRVTL